jgi:phage terminase large subunit
MNEITFSHRYQPLFDLLNAWSERDRIKAKSKLTRQDKEDLEYFTKLSNVDTVLISGGRDSGKSFGLSTFNAIASSRYNHRILYTRYTMSSTDNSITSAIENRLQNLGVEDEFDKKGSDYTHCYSNGKISITGQKTSVGTQTAKLKSLEDYSIFETDEGEELKSFEEWKTIKRSMRSKDVQALSIIIFNPPTKDHWLYSAFYEDVNNGFNGIKDKTLYIHTTYLDNGKDNMAIHNWNEYEDLRKDYELYLSTDNGSRELLPTKVVRNFKEYKHRILGSFKEKAEGVIYENWTIGDYNYDLPYCFGLDFGSNDPDGLTRVSVDHGNKVIYLKEEFFKNNVSTEGLYDVLVDRCGYSDLIVADNAERRMIQDYHQQGLNIVKCDKSMPVGSQIKMLQGYDIIVDSQSKNLITAFNNYVWNDKKSGVPKHDYSDLMDSWRYGVYRLINPKVVMF